MNKSNVADFPYPSVESADAIQAIEHYVQQGWTDGLPIIPPTAAKVTECLDAVGLKPDEPVLSLPMVRRQITASLAATNAVMAGCLPSYFPVVLAALEGWSNPRWGNGDDEFFYLSNASTGGGGQLLIVNGPIRDELEINGGVNLYGPGVRANATIGRALRLILMNAAGFVPGIIDNATQGHPGKFSYCIAENQEESPWDPLHVDRNFDPDVSTVTTVGARGPEPVENRMTRKADGILYSVADTMSRVGALVSGFAPTSTRVVVMGPEHAQNIADEGWSKRDVKDFLFQHCRRPIADLTRAGMTTFPDEHERVVVDGVEHIRGLVDPEDVLLVVAGANNAGITSVITNWCYAIKPGDYVTTPIRNQGSAA